MKRFCPLLLLLVGCARFSTHQVDESSKDPTTGEETRIVTTRATSYTLWSSKSALTNLKISQTDKTQSTGVGSLSQEASGTNVVEALKAIASILEKVRP